MKNFRSYVLTLVSGTREEPMVLGGFDCGHAFQAARMLMESDDMTAIIITKLQEQDGKEQRVDMDCVSEEAW